MNTTRRGFLGGVLSAPFIALPSLAAPIRAPFVCVGESVGSLIWHLWDDPRNPAPMGPLWVHNIGKWDGVGYPIVLVKSGWRAEDRQFFTGFYDHEWANMVREIPYRFWAIPGHSERYPNVHAYLREKRFGESPDVMRATMTSNLQRHARRS